MSLVLWEVVFGFLDIRFLARCRLVCKSFRNLRARFEHVALLCRNEIARKMLGCVIHSQVRVLEASCLLSVHEYKHLRGVQRLFLQRNGEEQARPVLQSLAGIWPELESLSAMYFQLDQAGLQACALAGLSELNLYGSNLRELDLDVLVQAPLVKLFLMSVDLKPKQLESVSRLISLRVLDFGKNDSIGDDDLACLHTLTRLEVLRLSFLKISDSGIAWLAGLARLRDLGLAFTKVQGRALSRLKAVESLDLAGCFSLTDELCPPASVRKLVLASCWNVTHSSLARLGTKVQDLDITDCKQVDVLNDIVVSSLPNLRFLRIDGTRHEPMRAKLQAAYPTVDLIFSS